MKTGQKGWVKVFMDNNLKDGKTQIKLNRKMRMWHKYRNYCIGAAGVLVVLVICIGIINVMGKSATKDKDDAAVPPTTATQQAAQTQPQTTQAPTEAPTQAPTQEATTEASTTLVLSSTLTVAGSAETQEFTSEEFYSDAVFLGDSIVSGISYYGFLEDSQVVADGNMTTDKALDQVSSVTSKNPSKVFIMVGLNDVNYGTRGADVIAENLVTLANEVKSGAPSAKVYILSLLPVTNNFETKTTNQISQAAINDVNDAVSVLAASAGFTYIDVASAFKDTTGYLGGDYTSNGSNIVHDYYPFLLNSIAGVAK